MGGKLAVAVRGSNADALVPPLLSSFSPTSQSAAVPPNVSSSASHYLLLVPSRTVLHSFLSERDVARLMRTCRGMAVLLDGYVFRQQWFGAMRPVQDGLFVRLRHMGGFSSEPTTPAKLRRLVSLYEKYGVHIRRMRLPSRWTGSLYDTERGRSLLPLSLESLVLGERESHLFQYDASMVEQGYVLGDALEDIELTAFPPFSGVLWEYQDYAQLHVRTTRMLTWARCVYPRLKCPGLRGLPARALPPAVRFLQLPSTLTAPLQVGSIPSSVERLILDHSIDQQLDLQLLPQSLRRLWLYSCFQLVAGEWPPTLQELRLSSPKHPILPGCLPPVTALRISAYQHILHVDVLPSSITHLLLELKGTEQLLRVGGIPEGVVHLVLAFDSPHALPQGALPTSLRTLLLFQNAPLGPGVLPAGLEILFIAAAHSLSPNVLPASLRLLDLRAYEGRLDVGVLPMSLSWLALPFGIQVEAGAIPADVRVVRVQHEVVSHNVPAHMLTQWRRDMHGNLTAQTAS